ncbi:hypothetical protein AG1IA_02968 [Rhizoctonia solani AG-1 IA]|uniref:Uncharacterized protein n=1 Tax=Thanatephorus cucumeris (strain AG1-IA) TaxID=983506 RepID=L8WYB0_THACA|nr:hypothetical protein AG1IA_02968 [Rhizoctonia solani AG-1 IA]
MSRWHQYASSPQISDGIPGFHSISGVASLAIVSQSYRFALIRPDRQRRNYIDQRQHYGIFCLLARI